MYVVQSLVSMASTATAASDGVGLADGVTIDSAPSEPSEPSEPPLHPETTTARVAAIAQVTAIVARPRRLSWILMAFSSLDVRRTLDAL